MATLQPVSAQDVKKLLRYPDASYLSVPCASYLGLRLAAFIFSCPTRCFHEEVSQR